MLPLHADPRVATLSRALRPEFRVERFVPPPGHFLAPTPCRIPACPRGNAAKGLCGVHDRAWRKAGSPEREGWIADPANANGNGDGGHEFGVNLTDDERWAIIEYLKTF